VNLARVVEVLDLPPVDAATAAAPPAAPAGHGLELRFDGVHYRYGDDPPALADVNLCVAPGERVASSTPPVRASRRSPSWRPGCSTPRRAPSSSAASR
jgi:ABC-type multidrug transport system fused ATPase/permease subunit